MTQDALQQREALRLNVLHKVFEAARGTQRESVDLALLPGLGGTRDDVLEAARYLVREDLLAWLGSGVVYLTPRGAKEIEAALRAPPERGTKHFSAPTVQQLIPSQRPAGGGAQTGGTSHVEPQAGASTRDVLALVAEIRAALPETAAHARDAADDLCEELAASSPKPSRVRAFAGALWAGAQRIVEVAPRVLDLYDRLKVPRPPTGG